MLDIVEERDVRKEELLGMFTEKILYK